MHRIQLATTLGLAVLLTNGGNVRGQTQSAIAGDFLGMLRDQLTWSQVALKDDKIRSFVVGNQLAVIVIPPTQIDPDKPAVFVCMRKQTDLQQQEIKKEDLAALTEFAKETVYRLILDLQVLVSADPKGTSLPAEAKQKVAELQKRMAAMPEKQRSSFTFLMGARLAELEPTQPEVAGFVTTFRKEAERRALSALTVPHKDDFGRPRVFGTTGVTKGALNSIKDVQEVEVGGHRYQKTWAGGSLILVPQPKDSPRPADSDPPLKKLGLHEDVHKVIKDAHPSHVVITGSTVRKQGGH